MFLSVNMKVREFNDLVNEYHNILVLQTIDISDVKEYLIKYMDPNSILNERRFYHISEKLYMEKETKVINEYIDSLYGFDSESIISVPIHTVNFLKKFIQNDKCDFFIHYINEMISYVNMEYTFFKELDYNAIDIRTVCEDFGKDVFWRFKE